MSIGTGPHSCGWDDLMPAAGAHNRPSAEARAAEQEALISTMWIQQVQRRYIAVVYMCACGDGWVADAP